MDEVGNDGPQIKSRQVRIIMVHGTWAHGLPFKKAYRPDAPRWFEKGSRLQWQIETQLVGLGLEPFVEEPLLWSGDNSLFERAEAAQRLVERLKAMPLVPCLVITHSHGGNVVLRAIEELADEHVARLRVITMSTPFVEMYLPFADRPNYERLQLAGLLVCLGFAVGARGLQGVDTGALDAWPLLLSALVALWVGIHMFRVIVPLERLCMLHAQPCLARSLVKAAAFEKFKNRPPHLLVLRGVEDEAALIISAAGALGRVSQIARDVLLAAWHKKFRSVVAAGVVFAASLLALTLFAWVHGAEAAAGTDFIARVRLTGMITSGVIVVLPLAMAAITVVCRALAGFAAGRELFLIPHVEVSVSTSPDFNADVAAASGRIIRVLTFPRRGLVTHHIRHSIYDDENVVDQAMRPWLNAVFRQQQQPP